MRGFRGLGFRVWGCAGFKVQEFRVFISGLGFVVGIRSLGVQRSGTQWAGSAWGSHTGSWLLFRLGFSVLTVLVLEF